MGQGLAVGDQPKLLIYCYVSLIVSDQVVDALWLSVDKIESRLLPCELDVYRYSPVRRRETT